MKKFSELRRTWFDSDEDVNHCKGNMSINWITDGRKLLDEEEVKEWAREWIKELDEQQRHTEDRNIMAFIIGQKRWIKENILEE